MLRSASIDHGLSQARQATDGRVALQGNDPAVLFAPPDIRARKPAGLASYGEGPGHAQPGHGITPDVDPDQVAVLIDTVQIFHSFAPC